MLIITKTFVGNLDGTKSLPNLDDIRFVLEDTGSFLGLDDSKSLTFLNLDDRKV